MSLTLHDVSVPIMVRALRNMAGFLRIGQAHAERHGIPEGDLVDARLIEDMMPLKGQVQRASDTARYAMVRVAGAEPASMADDETGFADLQARIAATIAYLEGVPPSAFVGKEDVEMVVQLGGAARTFTGRSYLLDFALPNFFFHVTTAYDVLRKNGVPVGKVDFLGGQ